MGLDPCCFGSTEFDGVYISAYKFGYKDLLTVDREDASSDGCIGIVGSI